MQSCFNAWHKQNVFLRHTCIYKCSRRIVLFCREKEVTDAPPVPLVVLSQDDRFPNNVEYTVVLK